MATRMRRAGVAVAFALLLLIAAPAALATAPVEGEAFSHPQGTSVVSDPMYSGGQALKFTDGQAVATKQITITEASNVLVRARAGQTGGSPTLTIKKDGVNVGTRRITSNVLADNLYSGIVLQPGTHTIGLKGGNLHTGRNVYVDSISFPAVTPPDTTGIPVSFAGAPPEYDGTESTLHRSTNALFVFQFTDPAPDSDRLDHTECDLDLNGQPYARYDNCQGSASYSFLPEGNYTFTVRAYDDAGNFESATRNFRVELYPAPVISTPATGSTAATPITFSGTGSTPGDLISIRGTNPNGSSFEGQQTTIAADGTWSLQVTPLAGDGSYEFWAAEHDPQGHQVSGESQHISVTVDTTPDTTAPQFTAFGLDLSAKDTTSSTPGYVVPTWTLSEPANVTCYTWYVSNAIVRQSEKLNCQSGDHINVGRGLDYGFYAVAKDPAGNVGVSPEYEFRTNP